MRVRYLGTWPEKEKQVTASDQLNQKKTTKVSNKKKKSEEEPIAGRCENRFPFPRTNDKRFHRQSERYGLRSTVTCLSNGEWK